MDPPAGSKGEEERVEKRNCWTQIFALGFIVFFISLLPVIAEAVSPVVEWELGMESSSVRLQVHWVTPG